MNNFIYNTMDKEKAEDFIKHLINDERKNLMAVDFSDTIKENIVTAKIINNQII